MLQRGGQPVVLVVENGRLRAVRGLGATRGPLAPGVASGIDEVKGEALALVLQPGGGVGLDEAVAFL